jgi:hypothetical protein
MEAAVSQEDNHLDPKDIRELALTTIAEERQEQLKNKSPDVPPIAGSSDCAPVVEWINNPPPPQQWILKGIIPESVVGLLSAAGGVGKSFLALLMAIAIALGKKIGPFEPPAPNRVLILNVEDPSDEIWRRIHSLAKQYELSEADKEYLGKNLLIYPGRGVIGPLMKFNGINPSPSEWAKWLSESVKSTKPVLVILDTKSRLYGLDENSNDHTTQWLRQPEKISTETGCSFLILHHTSKGRRNDLETDASRGASALTDNCRFVLTASPLDERDIKAYDLNTPSDYFKVLLSKVNYSTSTPIWYFQRGLAGVPVPVDLGSDRLRNITTAIRDWLSSQEETFTYTDLTKGSSAGTLRKELKATFSAKRNDIPAALGFGLESGLLRLESLPHESRGKARSVYLPGGDGDEVADQEEGNTADQEQKTNTD